MGSWRCSLRSNSCGVGYRAGVGQYADPFAGQSIL